MLKFCIFCFLIVSNSLTFSSGDDAKLEVRRFRGLLQEISGSHLRFSATHLPPFLTIIEGPNGTFSYRGVHVAISDFLARILNITYSFVNARIDEENQVGLKEAAINLLIRNEVEIITYGFGLSLDHCTRLDCSRSLTASPYGLMVPWPEEESRLLAPIKPFQHIVWVLLCCTLITMTFVLVWIPGLYLKFIESIGRHPDTFTNNAITNYRDISSAAINVMAILTAQGNWSRFKQLSFRVVLTCWYLGAFVLINAYSSTLFSYLTVPKLLPVAKSFEDLAAGYPQQLKILTEKNSILATEYFQSSSTSKAFRVLGHSLRDHPETLFTTRKNGFDLMDTGHYAYSSVEQLLYTFMESANKRVRNCRFTISNKNLPISPLYLVYAFHKNWRYTNAVNYKMQIGCESGLILYWLKTFQPKIDRCMLDYYQDATPKQKKLSLKDLSGAFVVLSLGLVLSLLAFLVELILNAVVT